MQTTALSFISAILLGLLAAAAVADDDSTGTGTTGTSSQKSNSGSTGGSTGTGTGTSTGTGTGTATGTGTGTALTPLSPAGEGRRAFLKYNCSVCHGDRAAGAMGPNIQHAESGDINEVVKGGGEGGMPAYGTQVSATELANLGIYLRSIGTATEPKFYDWWVTVPTK